MGKIQETGKNVLPSLLLWVGMEPRYRGMLSSKLVDEVPI